MTQSHFEEDRPLSLEEKLTAWVLGELPESEIAEVEAAVAADPELAARKEALEATLGMLRQQAPDAELAPERREALRRAAAAAAAGQGAARAVPGGKLLSFTRFKWAAAALVFAGGIYLASNASENWGAPAVEESASLPDAASRSTLGDDRVERRFMEIDYADGQGAAESEEDFRGGKADAAKLGEVAAAIQDPVAGAPAGEPPPVDLGGRLEFDFPFDPNLSVSKLQELSDAMADRFRTLGHVDKAPAAQEGVSVLHLGKSEGEAAVAAQLEQLGLGGRASAEYPARFGGRGVEGKSADQRAREEIVLRTPVSGGVTATPTAQPDAAGVPVAPGAATTPGAPRSAGSPPPGTAAPPQRSPWDDYARAGQQAPSLRFADEPVEQLEELAQLGYVGQELGVDLEQGGRFEERRRGTSGIPVPSHCVRDGYGREWCGEHILHYLRPVHGKESPRDMFFRYYGDNPRVLTEHDALSTFAADVDTASYPLVRNYLVNGQLPPKEAVRTEEFVNYFPNALKPPAEGDFALSVEHAPSLFGGDGTRLVKVGVKAREVSRAERKPMNLVFVIDRSGSMAKQNRIELVKRSLELLVDQLREDDTVGIVSFESRGHHELDPTPGYERWQIREAVRKLETGGSTNAEAGLLLGYEMAEKSFREGAINRIVLCSDGVANTGETDQARILERVRTFSERQIDLTAIGVGMGNHNDVFLEQIADKGNGSCHYVDDFEEAKRVFVEQFTGTLQTVARDVKIQVEFDPKVVAAWRQLGYENRAIADQDFRNDSVDAGEVGAGHEVVALYELTLMPEADAEAALATVRLRWFPDGANEANEMERKTSMAEGTERFGLADARLRLSAVAAQYAEVLRRSYWAREDSYADLLREAEELVRELSGDAQVRELRDMIRRTRRLVEARPHRDDLSMLIEEARTLRLLEAEANQVEERSAYLESKLQELHERNEELEKEIRTLIGVRR